MNRVDLITVPFPSSGTVDGVARAAGAILDAGPGGGRAVAALAAPGAGPGGPGGPGRGLRGLLVADALAAMVEAVAARVDEAWTADRLPVVLGGDRRVLLGGLVAATRRGYGAGLVFVDGHEDACDPRRSPTGEAADSAIGLALGWVPAPAALSTALPCLQVGDLVRLGPHDAGELADAGQPTAAGRVTTVPGARLATADGIREAHDAAAALIRRTTHWWLHVDLDVTSTDALAARDSPQPGGPSWPQLEELTASLLTIGGCGGVSISMDNPDLDGGAAHRVAEYVAGAARLLDAHAG